MRLTADQWLEQLARRLASGRGGPGAPGRVNVDPAGTASHTILNREVRRFSTGPADAPFEVLAQLLPAGYYDTVDIAWTHQYTAGEYFPQKAIRIWEGRYNGAPEGIYTLSILFRDKLVTLAGSHALLATRNPQPGGGLPGEMGSSMRYECMLTNAPIFVTLTDDYEQVVNQSVAGSGAIAVCVILQTLRH